MNERRERNEKGRTMKGKIKQLIIGGRSCSLYLPPEYEAGGQYPVIYMNGTDEFDDILGLLEPQIGRACVPFLLLNVESIDWNNDLTPWPSPALNKKSSYFGGHADTYLDFLSTIIKPHIDTHYHTKSGPEDTGLIGYSLGGLTALYALYKYESFGKIGCLSGSLWFDNWLGFMSSHRPLNAAAKVYMSLGTKEQESKNDRMAAVGQCTMQAAEILKSQLNNANDLNFEWNDGGHFTQIPQRYTRSLFWLMRR